MISSEYLVPGDVFALNDLTQIPCEAVLIAGNVMMNESALSGNTEPIKKTCLGQKESVINESMLFDGTAFI